MQTSVVEPLKAEFINFDEDMSRKALADGVELLYAKNELNDLFELSFTFNLGNDYDPSMSIARGYAALLGSKDMSLEEFKAQMYKLASSMYVSVNNKQTTINISGLQENLEATMALVEGYLRNLVGDDAILQNYKDSFLKSRHNRLFNQQTNFSALTQYALYGGEFIDRVTLSDAEVEALTSEELLERIARLFELEHRVTYYGPASLEAISEVITKHHAMAEEPTATDAMKVKREILPTAENRVIILPYPAKQVYYRQISNRGEVFSVENDAIIELYNSYFSGGMNSIVFQEMREARGLAYSASAGLYEGNEAGMPYYFTTYIATQNDKVQQAIEAFADIVDNMPVSENAFALAKESYLKSVEARRLDGRGVISTFLRNELMDLSDDRAKAAYEKAKTLTLDDVVAFQQEWIKNRPYTYLILGDPNDIDLNYLSTLGTVEIVAKEKVFCY